MNLTMPGLMLQEALLQELQVKPLGGLLATLLEWLLAVLLEWHQGESI
jgi:hypothetical protein